MFLSPVSILLLALGFLATAPHGNAQGFQESIREYQRQQQKSMQAPKKTDKETPWYQIQPNSQNIMDDALKDLQKFKRAPQTSVVETPGLFTPGTLKRIQEMTGNPVEYKYDGLGITSRCSKAGTDENVYLCATTSRNAEPSFQNAYLLINMDQKIMFIVNENPNKPCSSIPSIIGLHHDSRKATTKNFPDKDWGEAFSNISNEYRQIFGCNTSTSTYKFDGEPFGFSMRWRMPWEYNISNPDPLVKIR